MTNVQTNVRFFEELAKNSTEVDVPSVDAAQVLRSCGRLSWPSPSVSRPAEHARTEIPVQLALVLLLVEEKMEEGFV